MSFFVFPQKWIAAAISAGVMAFGPIGTEVHLHYVKLPGAFAGASRPPDDIAVDKRPKSAWPKWKAQCVIIHEYGHLAGRRHSSDPRSIMRPSISKPVCLRFLRRYHLR